MENTEEEYNKIIRIALFEYVQKFPYRVCPGGDSLSLVKNGFGDCRHKHNLLYELFQKIGLDSKKVKVLFDWKDLPLPEEMLDILKESDSVWGHNALVVKIDGKEVLVDATWPKKLKEKGFPITDNWDGLNNTEKITSGKTSVISIEEYKEYKSKMKLVPEEMKVFAVQLNDFIEKALATN